MKKPLCKNCWHRVERHKASKGRCTARRSAFQGRVYPCDCEEVVEQKPTNLMNQSASINPFLYDKGIE